MPDQKNCNDDNFCKIYTFFKLCHLATGLERALELALLVLRHLVIWHPISSLAHVNHLITLVTLLISSVHFTKHVHHCYSHIDLLTKYLISGAHVMMMSVIITMQKTLLSPCLPTFLASPFPSSSPWLSSLAAPPPHNRTSLTSHHCRDNKNKNWIRNK